MAGAAGLERLIDELEVRLSLSAGELAGALGVVPQTVERWRTGERFPQHEARRRLDALTVLRDRLDETCDGRDAVAVWLRTNSNYLGGRKPVEALRVGRIDAVNAAIEALDSGVLL